MNKTWFILTDEGKEARNAVLLALTGRSNPAASSVYNILGTDKQIIRSIVLDKVDKSFTSESLKNFFVLAIEKIAGEHQNKKQVVGLTEFRNICHLNLYFTHCCGNNYQGKGRWEILDAWISKLEKPRISKAAEREVVQVLNVLNCDRQVEVFNTSLNKHCSFYNFSVVAPTYFVQAWLLKRLLSILPTTDRFKNRSKMYLIDVEKIQCFEYPEFLDGIIEILSVPATPDSTDAQKLVSICDCNLPKVLVIRNYQGYGEIMARFTENLAELAETNNTLSPTPRLMIFWIDTSVPNFNISGDYFSIDPLNEISLGDITNWVQRHNEKHTILNTYESTLNNRANASKSRTHDL